jgi:hypothetical protein
MRSVWQDFDDHWPSCHSWWHDDDEQHRAMTLVAALSLFGLLVLAAAVATALAVRGDGYRRRGWAEEPATGAAELPWVPYRDAATAPWPW